MTGNITIGDNVIVATKTAVVKDVSENLIARGNFEKAIREYKEHKLFD